MRYLLVLLFLLNASLALAADPAKEVKAAADALNEAFEKHDAKTIRALMTPDHLAITPYAGKQRVKDQIRTLPVLLGERRARLWAMALIVLQFLVLVVLVLGGVGPG